MNTKFFYIKKNNLHEIAEINNNKYYNTYSFSHIFSELFF